MTTADSQPQPTPPTAAPGQTHRPAILGPSITIKGTLSGEEDLLIEGHVEGEVSFKKHAVTIGKKGRVDADMYCKSIIVEGEVNGNLYGDDLVVVRSSARVKGNAVAPRVSLEDGAQFQGAIDMQPKPAAPVSMASTAGTTPVSKPDAARDAQLSSAKEASMQK